MANRTLYEVQKNAQAAYRARTNGVLVRLSDAELSALKALSKSGESSAVTIKRLIAESAIR
jgi:hypothetical protein